MKQFFYLVICVLALTACTGGYKKGEKGLEYKLFAKGKGKKPNYGDIIQMQLMQVYNGGAKDSILFDSHEFMPRLQVLDSVNTPAEYFKILSTMRVGDSVVIRLLTDTLQARLKEKGQGQQLPPYLKKGKYLYTRITLMNIFENRAQADSANKAEMVSMKPRLFKKQLAEFEKEMEKNKEQLAKDDKTIAAYLAKNNIKAKKTGWGTYIDVHEEGTGEPITYNSIASVKYTGRSLETGVVFDSNVDTAFKHPGLYDVRMWEVGSSIMGWTDALQQMRGGMKATVYIPSTLCYGKNGNGDRIKPDAILVFDMDIAKVQSEDAYNAEQTKLQEEAMKKMQEAEQRKSDSLSKPGKK